MTFIDTWRARSEQSQAITSATSWGWPMRPRMSSRSMNSAMPGGIHPVSVAGGWTTLAVMPNVPSSCAAVSV